MLYMVLTTGLTLEVHDVKIYRFAESGIEHKYCEIGIKFTASPLASERAQSTLYYLSVAPCGHLIQALL